jgi:biotin carboxylase
MNCVVLIESNTSGTGRDFAQAARSLGFEPILLAEDPARYPYVLEDSVPAISIACIDNLGGLKRSIDGLAPRYKVCGIYSSSEYFIETAALLAQHYALSGPDLEAVRICRNKGLQRECLKAAEVGVPAFQRAASVPQAVAALDLVPLPVVIKPTMGTGSIGVKLCHSTEEVKSHARDLLAVTHNERGIPVPQEILVEQYVRWPEFSAEILNSQVLGITRKYVSQEPYFVETGHDFPSATPSYGQVDEQLQRAIKALGITWGPLHVEFRNSQSDFAIMEVNPRLAGGFIPELVRLATGIDMVRETISMVVGRDPELTKTRCSHASIRFVCPDSEGIISAINGMAEVAAMPRVADARLYKGIGAEFKLHHDFRDRIGHVVACADSEEEAAEIAETARMMLQVEVNPVSALAE